MSEGTDAFQLSGYRFPSGVMNWYYNDAGRPPALPKSEALATIQAGMAKWEAVCNFRFAYQGETQTSFSIDPDGALQIIDGVNIVGWVSGANVADIDANTNQIFWRDTRAFVDTEIEFNADYPEGLTADAVHEAGHALGLDHSDVAGQVMSGPPLTTYAYQTDLHDDDIAGCVAIYGPPGPAAQLPASVSAPSLAGTGSVRVEVTGGGDDCGVAQWSLVGPPGTFGAPPIPAPGVVFPQGLLNFTASRCATGGVSVKLSYPQPLPPDLVYWVYGPTSDNVFPHWGVMPATINGNAVTFAIPDGAAGDGDLLVNETILQFGGPGSAPPGSQAANYEGLWWTSPAGSESGWGINFAHQGEVIFATWFTYDLSGKAWWLTMTANKIGDGVYSGTLLETRGPAFNAVPFSPAAVTAAAVGSGTLTFTDSNNALFAYTDKGISQTKAITREAFATLPICTFGVQPDPVFATNYQDLWWAVPAGSESGWGVNFTHQSDTIFATWFTYDFDGSPLWLSATAPKTGTGVYAGTLNRTSGPAFNAVPFLPTNIAVTPVGTLTLTFANGNSATYAYTVSLPGQASVTQSKTVTRQVFRAPGTVCQ
jgi:hypothetical protein